MALMVDVASVFNATLPCSPFQWFCLVFFTSLLSVIVGFFDDDELNQYRVLRGPGRVFVLVGRICYFLYAGYGKLSEGSTRLNLGSLGRIPGMLTIYSGALAMAAYCCSIYSADLSQLAADPTKAFWTTPTAALLSLYMLLHFVKRCVEVVFVHHGTARVEVVCAVSIMAWYLSNVAVYVWLTDAAHACGGPPSGRAVRLVGTALWLVGVTTNAYHHLLLRWLRSDGDKQYKLPTGGLFAYVTGAHYFCELVGWFGLSLLCGHLVVWVMSAMNIAYLIGRSVMTTRWYRAKFEDYPEERKHLVPFLF